MYSSLVHKVGAEPEPDEGLPDVQGRLQGAASRAHHSIGVRGLTDWRRHCCPDRRSYLNHEVMSGVRGLLYPVREAGAAEIAVVDRGPWAHLLDK